jgi:hypothetical protein
VFHRLSERLKLKWDDIRTRVRGNMTATVQDKMNILANIHQPPAEGNFCDDHGNALKPAIVQECNKHMGYVDK